MQLEFSYFKDGVGGPLSPKFLDDLRVLSRANTFVETGTYMGNTVESVRKMFDQVVSIELSKELYAQACERFAGINNVKLFQGKSEDKLKDALTIENNTISIIWLDAHYSGEGTSKSSDNTPILSELEVIDDLGRDEDIIMIDDIRMFGHIAEGFLKHEAILGYPDVCVVVDKIQAMGRGYDCFILADILLALPVSLRGKYSVSSTLQAASNIKFNDLDQQDKKSEEIKLVTSMSSLEQSTILSLPDLFAEQLEYGLGGDFCYWRYLVNRHLGELDMADADYNLWQRCINF